MRFVSLLGICNIKLLESKRLAVNKCTNCTLPHIAYLITTAVTVTGTTTTAVTVTVTANTVTVMHKGRFSLDSAISFNRDYVNRDYVNRDYVQQI